jgi:hypothetical protein
MKNFKTHFLVVLTVCFWPMSVFAAIVDPGNVGSYFTYSSVGSVDSLDGTGFTIQFADSKYITVTPYEADARFVFGIDFNSTGLDPEPISGYLIDNSGAEIAGTAFTGTAISSGFGNGIVTLNNVVVAYGAHITFTDGPPITPFQFRFGAGVLSNVFEDRPVIGQGAEPPPPSTYPVTVSVTGLRGINNADNYLELANNGIDPITIFADGTFSFPTELPDGASYDVTVTFPPVGQTCTVTNGSGRVESAPVIGPAVDCVEDNPASRNTAVPVPALNRYGLAALVLLMIGLGVIGMRRFN